MWYLKACRSCLTTAGHFEKIDPQVKRLFCVITGLQMDEGDGFPQYFCAECYVHIKKAFQFRRKSRRAHFVLKEIQTIRKQVTQCDVEKVDRKKTNLISPYTLWKPENVATYSFITSDAIETLPKEEITPDIKAAIEESLNEPKFDIKCDVESKTIQIDIKPERNVETKQNLTLVKCEPTTFNSSSILIDIKPANWKEIEREEEERRQRERQMEIDAAMREIQDDNVDYDNGPANDDFVPEDIDLEDVFKGLKEESVRESESEPEVKDILFMVPFRKTRKKKQISDPKPKLPDYIDYKLFTDINNGGKARAIITEAFPSTTIKLLTLEEQTEIYHMVLNRPIFKMAPFKCAICVKMFKTVNQLCDHVVLHNDKINFPHFCKICKDRFETEDELIVHGARRHWYKYSCSNCNKDHFTLERLLSCFRATKTTEAISEKLKNNFKIRPLRPKEMYRTTDDWTGAKSRWRCHKCRICFSGVDLLNRHMKKHGPMPPPYAECDICSLKMKREFGLTSHMMNWHLFSYKCKQCKMSFKNRAQARIHLIDAHSMRTCRECNKQFNTEKWKYETHIATAHKVDCNMCTHVASSSSKLILHHLVDHGYIRLNTEAELNDPSCYCGECKVYFTEERLLFSHVVRMKHDAAKKYDNACIPCVKLFESKEEAQQHFVTCEKSYPKKCTFCEEVMESPPMFVSHKIRAHKDLIDSATKLCDTCGKVISCAGFYKHMRVHKQQQSVAAKDAQIPCRFCPTTAMTTTLHVSHVLYNHTAKPYCCTLCGGRFVSRCSCRDHILKMHAPVRPYVCEACNHKFAHLDFLHEHCSKVHNVHLKSVDKSVFLSKRMCGKIYVYPDMKIDGSLINLEILEKTPVEICDYMDDSNKPIDYKEAFFFDPEVDPSEPTRPIAPPKKINRKRYPEALRRKGERKKEKRRLRRLQEKALNDTPKIHIEYDAFGNIVNEEKRESVKTEVIENIEEDVSSKENIEFDNMEEDVSSKQKIEYEDIEYDNMEEDVSSKQKIEYEDKEYDNMEEDVSSKQKIEYEDIEYDNMEEDVSSKEKIEYENVNEDVFSKDNIPEEVVVSSSKDKMECENTEETEDVLGQLIEKDGQYFVLVDGVLYAIEESVVENLKEQ